MKKIALVLVCLNVVLLVDRPGEEASAGSLTPAGNGDVNADGGIDISDPIYLFSFLFSGGPVPVAIAQNGGGLTPEQEAKLAAMRLDGDTLIIEGVNVQKIAGFTFVEINAQGYPEYDHDSSGIRFVRLPGGSFEMGSPASESGRGVDEGPVHTVSLRPFLIAKYEVTQAEYESVMGSNPSSALGPNLPVERVSWDDLHVAGGFLARTGLSLPSEAQWEYACRGGTPGSYSGIGNLDDMGWYTNNSGNVAHDVGLKQANQFGLHDLHGNVWEWCEDVYKSDFYSDEVPGFDPVSTSGSGNRVFRGGGFLNDGSLCRSGFRFNGSPGFRVNVVGFRPTRPLP